MENGFHIVCLKFNTNKKYLIHGLCRTNFDIMP